jgi:hypothetical protein
MGAIKSEGLKKFLAESGQIVRLATKGIALAISEERGSLDGL